MVEESPRCDPGEKMKCLAWSKARGRVDDNMQHEESPRTIKSFQFRMVGPAGSVYPVNFDALHSIQRYSLLAGLDVRAILCRRNPAEGGLTAEGSVAADGRLTAEKVMVKL